MKKTNPLWIGALAIAFSCSNAKISESNLDSAEVNGTVPSQNVSLPATITDPPSDLYSDGHTKLIKTANYRFEVTDSKKSTQAIEAAIKKYQAYIATSSVKLVNPMLETNVSIRVQNEYFEPLLKEIDQQAQFVNFRNITTEDVSKDIVDLESRLRTKREVEDRYREILRTKTGTIKEVLEAEQQIGELHEEIEAAISRITYLRDQVKYSTINLEYYQQITETIATTNEPGIGDRLKTAFLTGWDFLTNVALGIIYIWPFFIFAATGYWLYKKYKRKITTAPQV